MLIVYIGLFIFYSMNSYGWSGYDWSKGTFIDIEKGELVREGEEITIFDYGENSGYRNIEVRSMNKHGGHVEIEGIDVETDEIRKFEME